jgi:hypothetical protein
MLYLLWVGQASVEEYMSIESSEESFRIVWGGHKLGNGNKVTDKAGYVVEGVVMDIYGKQTENNWEIDIQMIW